jgi:hypothetical protein
MALIWNDRVLETSTTTGTGAFTLAAAVTGYQRFSAAMSTSDTCYYCIYAVDGNGNPSGDWETGLGTYSSANTLTRTTPIQSTNADAAVNFAAGTKYVMLSPTGAFVDTLYRSGGTDVALADGGTGASLADPGADRVMFWDDSAGAVTWLTMGTGLTITGTTLDSAGGALTLASTVTQSGTPVATSVGFLGAPQMSDQDDYTLALTDAGGHYYHVSGSTHTLTIPANGSIAFPIGTVINIINENGGGVLNLVITSDTLRWGSSTGSRTISANGVAAIMKVTSTVWRLTGTGIA